MKKNQSNIKTMMNQRSFRLNMLLFQQHAPFHIKVDERFKQNLGTVPAFILISSDPKYSSPIVYWQPFFNSMSDIELADYLTQYCKNHSENAEGFISMYQNKDFILNHVYPRILAKRDAKDLNKNGILFTYPEDMPDFITSYYIDLNNGRMVVVTNNVLDHIGITIEELHKTAVKNVLDAVVFRIMFNVNAVEIVNDPTKESHTEVLPFWEATLPDGIYGAGVLAGSQKMFQLMATRIGSKRFFILASNIHQVVLVPDNGDTNKTYQIALLMNKKSLYSHLIPRQRLGDKVYHYDSTTGLITQYK